MPSTKLIRNRIKAVGSTAKITRAMQMVAASKMKKAQEATLKNRPYAEEAFRVYLDLKGNDNIEHPLVNPKKGTRRLLVVITSDKGLCGSFNSAILRYALNYIKKDPEKTDLITVGKKGQNFFRRLKNDILATFTDFPISPREHDVRPLLHALTDYYQKGDYKEVAVCYTIFETTLKQTTSEQTILPLGVEVSHPERNMHESPFDEAQGDNLKSVVKFEPTAREVINYLIPRILETQLYQMFLESIASEQSARMVAMQNATKAANDLIDDLKLTYNSVRQASITQELAEISAGANISRD